MTDHDDLEQFRHGLFGAINPDSTNSTSVTLEQVAEFSQAYQRRNGRTDAEIKTDPLGNPISVGESYPVMSGGLAISQADAIRLGIPPGIYPGVRIIKGAK